MRRIGGDHDQRESFERFRRHLWNPEVITYDELYARAEFIVARTTTEEEPEPDAEPPPVAGDEWDDLPF